MAYTKGFMSGDDDVPGLAVEAVEERLLRIYNDRNISRRDKYELLESCLDERKRQLDTIFVCDEDTTARIHKANELIKRRSTEAVKLAWQHYRAELAQKEASSGAFRDVAVSAELTVPADIYSPGVDSIGMSAHDAAVWSVLCSDFNRSLRDFSMLSFMPPFKTSAVSDYHTDSVDEAVRKCVCDYSEECPNWGDMWRLAPEDLRGIVFVRPFHNLYDYCKFAMSDILKIRDYNIKVRITDETA